MTVKAVPGPALEVVKSDLLFQLLMRLLADPTRFDGCSQLSQVRPGWQVGQIVLLLPRAAMLTDQPGLLAGKMLLALVLDSLWRPIGDPHANSGKTFLRFHGVRD